MPAATGSRVAQLQVLAVVAGNDVRLSQLSATAVFNYPAEGARVSQLQTTAVTDGANKMRVSQLQVVAVVRGKVDNYRLRAWTYSLDGHDFYVLQIGESGTLVHDLTTGQWSEWKSPDRTMWRAVLGTNWTGIGAGALTDGATNNNVVIGDDTYGILWTLAPERAYDEDPDDLSEQAFDRIATGGVAMRMRDTIQCNEVYVLGSKGETSLSLATPTISLRTSDDSENNWTDQGTINVVAADWEQEFAWRSLGLIGAPGRIFELTDNCIARIDGMEVR